MKALASATATAVFLPVLTVGGASPSTAAVDGGSVRGRVVLPDGRPAAAAVIDLSALNADGSVIEGFHRAVAGPDGAYTANIYASPWLRLIAQRNGGIVPLRADVSDISSNGQHTPVTGYLATLTGTATVSPAGSPYSILHDSRLRLVSEVTDIVLSTLSAINPGTLADAIDSLPEPGGQLGQSHWLTRMVDETVQPILDNPPDDQDLVAAVKSIQLYLNNLIGTIVGGIPDQETIVTGVNQTIGLLLAQIPDTGPVVTAAVDAVDDLTLVAGAAADAAIALAEAQRQAAEAEAAQIRQTVENEAADRIAETTAAVEEAKRQADQAVADATVQVGLATDAAIAAAEALIASGLTAIGDAEDIANAYIGALVAMAQAVIDNPPDVQAVVDLANATIAETLGQLPPPTVDVDPLLRSAMAQIDVHVTTAAAVAARVKNYDPDMMLGNDDVDDPRNVPPLGAVLTMIPVTDANDTELPEPASVDAGLPDAGDPLGIQYGKEDTQETGSSGCPIVKRFEVPAKGKPQPTVDAKMRVILKARHCKAVDDDKDRDYYAWDWSGKATNTDPNGFVSYVVRLKFRTLLNRWFDRDDEDPKQDIPTGDSKTVTWNVGFEAIATGGISGQYTVVKAERIHPWSDYEGDLYHVSWMSNKSWGSRGADFWNGGGNAFVTPQGSTDVPKKAQNAVYIWTCWNEPGYHFVSARAKGCDDTQP